MEPKTKQEPEAVVREIRRQTRRKFSSDDKIRIILEGLKGEDSIASIARREGIILLCLAVPYFPIFSHMFAHFRSSQ